MFYTHGTTEYPNTFKRQGSYPLDNSTVFNSLMDANEYAESSNIAYEGQIISIIDDDTTHVCVLKKNNDDSTKKFKLVILPLTGLNEYIIDIYNLVNSKIGIWSITKSIKTNEAILDFDIWYGVDADSYEVYFNDELVSDKLLLSDEFATNLSNFIKDSIKIKLKFYKGEDEAFELNAKASYKNQSVIFGSLYLSKLSKYEEE